MDALDEIKELLKNGRQKSFTDKENSLIYFNKAKSIAKKENLEREIPLIDSFIQIYIEKDFAKADKLLDKYKESKNIQLSAYFYLLKGRIFSEKGDYDLVIEYCQKALDTPGFDTPGDAQINIGLAYSDKGDYDLAIEYYQKAFDTPGYDTPGDAQINMGNAYSDKGDYDLAIEYYQKALDTPGYDTLGNALYNMGNAYSDNGDYDLAIEYYQKALDTPGYDTPGSALNNMGIAYYKKGDNDLAIEYYQKALDTPGYDTLGNALNNMGNAYSDNGDNDRAIEYYQKALDTPSYDTPGDALNNIGIAYSEKDDNDLAIEYYQKALDTPGYDTLGNALYNMGNAYSDKSDYDRAIEYFQKALTEFENLGENEYVKKISYLIINLNIKKNIGRERFEASSIPDLSDKLIKEYSIKKPALKDPGEKIKQILDEFNITAYQKYAEEYDSRENDTTKQIDDDFLMILKGWSSSIPLVSGRINEYFEGNICKGGGYFIRWKGAGLVIDPGINFLENFHENKFHIADIDIVLITHNHLDHNYELLQINDAFYQTNKFLKNVKRQRYILDKETLDGKRSDLYKDIIEIETPFDTGTIDSGERDLKEKYNIIIKLFKTEHSKDVEHSTGAIIELFEQKDDNEPIIKIGLTSDTKYFPGLSEKLVDCDLIIPHFGMLDKKELDDENDDGHDTHLGFNGMKKIIEGTNADLYAITEFWGGRGDFRIDLIRKIIFDLNENKKNKHIIAGDVGCKIKLPSKHIICSNCNTVSNYKTTSTVRPEKSFGKLRYLCENCHSEMSTRL